MAELMFFMMNWISNFPFCSFFPPQLPAQAELIREALREVIAGYSGSISKGLVAFDINYMLATSTGLPFSINIITAAVSAAYLDGNIAAPNLQSPSKIHTNSY